MIDRHKQEIRQLKQGSREDTESKVRRLKTGERLRMAKKKTENLRRANIVED